MGETARRHRDLLRTGSGVGLERLIFFTDAVFAIAMTLLVIDLRIPANLTKSGEIGNELLNLVPNYLAYAISFAVIGANWVLHHRNFRLIKAYDTGMLWLNLGLLMFVAFLPFPTSVINEGDGPTSPISFLFYAGNVVMIGAFQVAIWMHAFRQGFVDSAIDDKLYRYLRAEMLTTPVVFALSVVVQFTIGAPWSLYFWFVLFPVNFAVARYEPRTRRVRAHPASPAL